MRVGHDPAHKDRIRTDGGKAIDRSFIAHVEIAGADAPAVSAASLDNTRETTAPMVVFSATAIEGNTVDLDSALDGTQVDVYLMV